MEYIFSIRIKPPQGLFEKIKTTKKKFGVTYAGNYDTLPHVTLYLSRFPEENFTKCVDELSKNLPASFSLALGDVVLIHNNDRNNSFLYLEVNKTKQLNELHEYVVKVSNKYRDGLIREKDTSRIKSEELSGKLLENTQEWGYRYVFEQFNAHITLGELESNSKQSDDVVKSLKEELTSLKGESFEVVSIIVELSTFNKENNRYDILYSKELKL